MAKKKDEMLFDDSRAGLSRFGGTAIELFCVVILQYLMIIITLGFGTPWALCMRERWRTENMVIDGKQVVFEGTGKKFFWRYMLWCFLTIITLGLCAYWMAVKMLRWDAKYTHFDNSYYTKIEPELI
jgi:uncharacterized membrane protein YjgN (DUF898 family)